MSRRNFIVLLSIVALGSASVAFGVWWHWSTQPEQRLAKGRSATQRGDLIQAVHYADLLRGAGADDHFNFLKAEIALKQNDPGLARDHLAYVAERGPLGIDAGLLRARCLLALRRPRDAEQALNTVLELNPNHIDAHRWLATIYYDQGDLARAAGLLEKVRTLAPADGRSMWLLGTIYRDMDQLEDAIPAYEESLRRDPNPPDVVDLRIELAECLLKHQRHTDILDTLRGIDTSAALALRAEALVGVGRESEAIAMLDAGLKVDSGHSGLLRSRGERYLVAGDGASAVLTLERALQSTPSDFRCRTSLAQAYEAVGRSADAEREHHRVQQLIMLFQQVHDKNQEAMKDPWDARVRLELADLCEKIDRPQLAQMWRRAAAACRAGGP